MLWNYFTFTWLFSFHSNPDILFALTFIFSWIIRWDWICCVPFICVGCIYYHQNETQVSLTLKKPGLLTPSHSRGGGGVDSTPPPPPSDLLFITSMYFKCSMIYNTNYVIWHIRKPCRERIVSRNFYTENQSSFQIMQIYVNFMHMFIFLIIFNKMRGFWVSKSFKYCHK